MTRLLLSPCDACGQMIGEDYKCCPKCNIYICMMCSLELWNINHEYDDTCPMCGGELGN